jgi:hypothetical protein
VVGLSGVSVGVSCGCTFIDMVDAFVIPGGMFGPAAGMLIWEPIELVGGHLARVVMAVEEFLDAIDWPG